MGMQVGSRKRGGFRDINVTPLVDVMLVLLIVFMVTAPLLTTGLRIDLPEVKAAETPVKDAQALRESQRVQKERELYIRADKDARYGIVAEVVAAARNSGVESLNLLVQPELEEAPDEPEKPGNPPAGGIPKPGAPSQKK